MLDSIFGVDLYDLLVVVGTLEEFEAGVEGTPVGAQQHSDGGDRWGEGNRVDCSSLHDLWNVLADVSRDVLEGFVVGFDGGLDGVLQCLRVSDRNRVSVEARSGNHGREGTEVSVFEVDGHLVGRRIGSVPQLNVRREGGSLSLHKHLDTVDVGVREGPRLQGTSLDVFRGEHVAVSTRGTTSPRPWTSEGAGIGVGVSNGSTGQGRTGASQFAGSAGGSHADVIEFVESAGFQNGRGVCSGCLGEGEGIGRAEEGKNKGAACKIHRCGFLRFSYRFGVSGAGFVWCMYCWNRVELDRIELNWIGSDRIESARYGV
mmetsp:Transcript_25638/g.54759  ORF Transcript_25638/g.54759 Transcript_25638/m.54759 type:complete len:316 (+) Transcript_25638:390-1337(+)